MKAWERVEEGKRQGEREEKGNGQGRVGKMYSMVPRHSFHLLFVNVDLTDHPLLPQALLN